MLAALSSRRTPAVLLALGLASAAALVAASLTDFGDPRIEARAGALQKAATHAREIQVGWEEARAGEGPLPGTVETYPRMADEPLRLGPVGAEDSRPTDPLLSALLASGRAALLRGEPEEALATFEEALRQTAVGARDRELVLFEAVRSAGTARDAEAAMRHRASLAVSAHDPVLHGTSGRLLSMLVEPIDPVGASEWLTGGEALMPPPQDEAEPHGALLSLELDPWWNALHAKLRTHSPELDWDTAFQVPTRRALAVETLIGVDPAEWTERWQVVRRDGAVLGYRTRGEVFETASLDESELMTSLLGPARKDLAVQLLAAGTTLPLGIEPRPLAGSPFAVTVEAIDPERAALPQLRRIRWIRGGLLGLGLLVMVASMVSARAAARARRLSELRSTFVASVSHDLRTPTQAILLLAETLEQELVLTPESRSRYHTQIRREAQRLRRLVEDLLDGARIDRGGGARIERRLTPTEPFFDELVHAMEERASAAGAALRVTVDSCPEALYIDPDGVHRAVWNLFENALAHGRRGDDAASVQVSLACDDGVLRCTVADSGPGIPARHALSVFDPFERLSDRGRPGGIATDTGTGLGLSIVRAIAEGHGGAARVEPDPDGARFVVTFQAEDHQEDVA